MGKSCFKTFNLRSLVGPTDCRSPIDEVGPGAYRYTQNVITAAANKSCRRPGWRKFLHSDDSYLNQDLHDQLLASQYYYTGYEAFSDTPYENTYCWPDLYQRGDGRQPITFLFEFNSSTGSRKFIAGTQNRLYALQEDLQNWRLLADGYGGTPVTCSPVRFHGAQSGDYLIVTNNFNEPAYWAFDEPVAGCQLSGLQAIPDLALIGLSKAARVVEWKGFIFFLNVEMDGSRFTSRLVWSDFNNPLSFNPQTGSYAGFQDLPYNETILAAAQMRDYLIIYTDIGIWRVIFTGDPANPFQFENLYVEPKSGDGCIVYPNTLVSLGDTHYYLSHESVYEFSLWTPRPVRNEWMFRASCTIFDDLKSGCCEHVVAGYQPQTKEMWISWPQSDASACCPTTSQVYNLQYRTSDVVDQGFTAYGNYRSDERLSLLAFVLTYCLCSESEVANLLSVTDKVGAFQTNAECDGTVTSLWNETENLDLPASATSLCALLGDTRLEDLCRDCFDSQIFVAASATDYCLKQIENDVYARERFTGYSGAPVCSGVSSGSYCLDPYTSIWRTGAWDLGKPQIAKTVREFTLEFKAEPQTVPSDLDVRIGYNVQAGCEPIWRAQPSKKLTCLTDQTIAQHVAANTIPDTTASWPAWYEGKFLFFEWSISGSGGAACFSRVQVDARLEERENLL